MPMPESIRPTKVSSKMARIPSPMAGWMGISGDPVVASSPAPHTTPASANSAICHTRGRLKMVCE